MVSVLPWAIVPKLHVSVVPPATSGPGGKQNGAPDPPTVHVSPLGNVSVSTTVFALPGPLFVTTMVNVAVSPAVISPEVGLFVSASTGV